MPFSSSSIAHSVPALYPWSRSGVRSSRCWSRSRLGAGSGAGAGSGGRKSCPRALLPRGPQFRLLCAAPYISVFFLRCAVLCLGSRRSRSAFALAIGFCSRNRFLLLFGCCSVAIFGIALPLPGVLSTSRALHFRSVASATTYTRNHRDLPHSLDRVKVDWGQVVFPAARLSVMSESEDPELVFRGRHPPNFVGHTSMCSGESLALGAACALKADLPPVSPEAIPGSVTSNASSHSSLFPHLSRGNVSVPPPQPSPLTAAPTDRRCPHRSPHRPPHRSSHRCRSMPPPIDAPIAAPTGHRCPHPPQPPAVTPPPPQLAPTTE
jgi:hypothetical protein